MIRRGGRRLRDMGRDERESKRISYVREMGVNKNEKQNNNRGKDETYRGKKGARNTGGRQEKVLIARGVERELDAFINHVSPQPGVFLEDLSNA